MKILLLGEFSALHKNLKEGLIELGHEVTIASAGDGFKQIESDIDLNINGNFISRTLNVARQMYYLTELVKDYDVVQLMNPFLFYHLKMPNKLFFKKLIQNSKKFYLLAAGSDCYFWKYGRLNMEYGPFEEVLKYDLNGAKKHFVETNRALSVNKYIADNADGIIPIMYEYEISYKGHQNLLPTIPIPMNTKKIKYEDNIINNKLVIFHGLNRYGFKGTKHVEEAFTILKKKYHHELELIIDGKMPLKKYLEVMRKTNIIIDQTNSYSLGVNGIYAMAMGKVVLGGAEPESLSSLGVKSSPVINIKPNAKSIVDAVEKLIENKNNINKIGLESRKFVEEIHDYKTVADKYLKNWNIK